MVIRQPPSRSLQVRLRNDHIGEKHLGELLGSRDVSNGPHVNTGRVHRDNQRTDALVFDDQRIDRGAHEAETLVAVRRVGRPYLLATDDERIFILHRSGGKVGEIRPGIGLAHPHTPHRAAPDCRRRLRLLGIVAELQKAWPHDGAATEMYAAHDPLAR